MKWSGGRLVSHHLKEVHPHQSFQYVSDHHEAGLLFNLQLFGSVHPIPKSVLSEVVSYLSNSPDELWVPILGSGSLNTRTRRLILTRVLFERSCLRLVNLPSSQQLPGAPGTFNVVND